MSSASTQKTILIVDDEENLVRLLEMNLRRYGYRILKAADGLEGLQSAEEHRPDLILSDVNMPHLDGFQMLERLKANQALADIPVVMLTARSRNQDIRHGVETGALHYVTKPVDLPALVSLVSDIFGGVSSEAAR
jgi:two-component system alkaline phosphatase synthesis response regulator PhoP